MSNSRYSVHILGQNKPLESLIVYNKHHKVHHYQHNVCKYLKDQDYLIFISKISLGWLKMAVPGIRKIKAFLQTWNVEHCQRPKMFSLSPHFQLFHILHNIYGLISWSWKIYYRKELCIAEREIERKHDVLLNILKFIILKFNRIMKYE